MTSMSYEERVRGEATGTSEKRKRGSDRHELRAGRETGGGKLAE